MEHDDLEDDRAGWEQMAQEEARRYREAHPEYEMCPKHPDRPVVDRHVCTRRFCAECIEDHQIAYIDWAIERDRDWMNHPISEDYKFNSEYREQKERK